MRHIIWRWYWRNSTIGTRLLYNRTETCSWINCYIDSRGNILWAREKLLSSFYRWLPFSFSWFFPAPAGISWTASCVKFGCFLAFFKFETNWGSWSLIWATATVWEQIPRDLKFTQSESHLNMVKLDVDVFLSDWVRVVLQDSDHGRKLYFQL